MDTLRETLTTIGVIVGIAALLAFVIIPSAQAANGAFDCGSVTYVQEESKVVACDTASGKCFTYGRVEEHDGGDFKFYMNEEPLTVEDEEGNIEAVTGTTQMLIQTETNDIIFRIFMGENYIGSTNVITCGPANVS